MCKQIKNPMTDIRNKFHLENVLEDRYAGLEKCGVLYFELDCTKQFLTEDTIAEIKKSIYQLQEETVHVYEYGEDGFLVVSMDCSKEQLRSLTSRFMQCWNDDDAAEGFSIGMAWSSAPVSLKSLMIKAMQEMLYNKKLMEQGIPLSYCLRGEITSSFGLLTRKQFFKNVGYRLKNSNTACCIVAIDVEHFKLFNKWYGRNAGDELLMALAVMLKKFEKEYGGIAAYFGGDDFAIFMPYCPETVNALEKALIQTVMDKTKTVGFLPAFGVYCVEDRNIEAVDMYDYAVEAVSKVLGHYEKRLCYYEKSMTSITEREIDIIAASKDALKNGEFVIYLQPQVRIGKPAKIVGAEALVRWISPVRGVVSPAEFIPILEKNGFIGELDQYVWELACKTIRHWKDNGIEPVPISVNISRVDILSFDTVGYLNDLIKKYEIDRKYLKVEITESAYVDDTEQILESIQQLREFGYMLMMDDFGSGYSSLNMLREAIVDIIKLDMQFLDMSDEDVKKGISILKSVVDMSNEINVPIVIEGVENRRQEDFLQDMGVRFAQGYFYYRPMPIEQFEALIKDEEKVDRRGIYDRDIDTENLNRAIAKMLENRNKRYEKIGIAKTRGGFLEYEAYGTQKLLNISQSVAYMFGCDTVEEFREYVGNSFMGMVHPDDRERVAYEINSQIASSEWKMDYIEYRILRKDGKVRYVYDYGHLEEIVETDRSCFYVFLLDVTDRL